MSFLLFISSLKRAEASRSLRPWLSVNPFPPPRHFFVLLLLPSCGVLMKRTKLDCSRGVGRKLESGPDLRSDCRSPWSKTDVPCSLRSRSDLSIPHEYPSPHGSSPLPYRFCSSLICLWAHPAFAGVQTMRIASLSNPAFPPLFLLHTADLRAICELQRAEYTCAAPHDTRKLSLR